MSDWKKRDYAVALANRHTFVVCLYCSVELAISQHYALAVARGSRCIEDVRKVLFVSLFPKSLHFRLAWIVVSHFEEVGEINGCCIVVGTNNRLVIDDDALKGRAEGLYTTSLVVLFLFTYKENAYRGIVDDILNLLLAACCIERYCYGTNAECSKVGKDVLNGVRQD